MSVSEKERFDWRVNFKLSEKVQCRSHNDNAFIKLEIENDEKGDWITGFMLNLIDVEETEVENIAGPQAKTLSDQISILADHYVQAYMIGCNQILTNGKERVWRKFESKWQRRVAIDLDLLSIDVESIKNTTSSSNERYHYAALGLKAASYEMDDMAILAWYQSIDGVTILRDVTLHYEPLRNALTHIGSLRKTTIQSLNNNFRGLFDITPNGLFDRNSIRNRGNLKVEAMKLRPVVINYFLYGKKVNIEAV